MWYEKSLTIPHGTAEKSLVSATIPVVKGVIHRVEVQFFPGPAREVSVIILHGEHQIFPTHPGSAFCSDAYTIAFDDYLELTAEPFELHIRGWAPSATYDHVVRVGIGLLDNQPMLFMLKVLRGLHKFLQLMRVPL